MSWMYTAFLRSTLLVSMKYKVMFTVNMGRVTIFHSPPYTVTHIPVLPNPPLLYK